MVDLSSHHPLSLIEVQKRILDYDPLDRIDFTALASDGVASLDFSCRSLGGAKFNGMQLNHLHAEQANLVGAHFKGTSLEGASFKGSDLRGADFSGANISYADFSDAKLDDAQFASCIGIQSAKLPVSIKKSVHLRDPSVQRFILIRYGLITGMVVVVSWSLAVIISNLTPLGSVQRNLDHTRAQLEESQRSLVQLETRREEVSKQLSGLQSSVATEQKILNDLKSATWETRGQKFPNESRLSRAVTEDIAKSLNQLLSGRPGSIHKYVLYFEVLDWVEQQFGSAGRLAVVEELVMLQSGEDNPGFAELIKTSGLARGAVTQAQVEQVLKERFDYIEKGLEGKQSFWTYKSNWPLYWHKRFEDAGML